ncbi:MAG: hypothetical protein A3K19_10440 [Lentisphaerae bacterium RIFOXYB12_FULL_65_16]|nr:MAG: hypothetical protein A3K18_32300 [Lentisphaerae bacterium RIFOXYA12_64_32]OGV91633.1 MAG: hypothetical protein A3K19_10440 [Lentisphaerae bacterium RIFOXYB12_FULL_65_16]
MRIIDAHAHLLDERGYIDGLLCAMDACGIERCCISGLGALFGFADDTAVRGAFRQHPDRFIGAVYIQPGPDTPDKIDRARQDGFRMVKVTLPWSAYDDSAHYPLWARAEALGLPVLFHTGVVTTRVEAPQERISSWNMHPMRLEPISRAFPKLKIIVAHLGIHWNDDAAELARMRPNVYVDLTGEPGGWRARVDAVGVEKWLWWPGAFDKVLFGTDVHYTKIARAVREDTERMDRLRLPAATREKVFAGNILNLLGEDAA